jgi:hypothetical protein
MANSVQVDRIRWALIGTDPLQHMALQDLEFDNPQALQITFLAPEFIYGFGWHA